MYVQGLVGLAVIYKGGSAVGSEVGSNVGSAVGDCALLLAELSNKTTSNVRDRSAYEFIKVLLYDDLTAASSDATKMRENETILAIRSSTVIMVGSAVGALVGSVVGSEVGHGVGSAVGSAVGVALSMSSHSSPMHGMSDVSAPDPLPDPPMLADLPLHIHSENEQ